MSAETWRVVLDDGNVREVFVERDGDVCAASVAGHPIRFLSPIPRRAVVAMAQCWPVREVLAPGEMTRDEAIAAAVAAEREACIDDVRTVLLANGSLSGEIERRIRARASR